MHLFTKSNVTFSFHVQFVAFSKSFLWIIFKNRNMFVTRVLRTHSRTTAQKLNMESLRARWRAHLLGNSVNYHLQSKSPAALCRVLITCCVCIFNWWACIVTELTKHVRCSTPCRFCSFLNLINCKNTDVVAVWQTELRRRRHFRDLHLNSLLSDVLCRVPTPPGKSWIFFLKIPGPGKSWKITLVLESPGN